VNSHSYLTRREVLRSARTGGCPSLDRGAARLVAVLQPLVPLLLAGSAVVAVYR
jgi:hypothetical protein